MTAVWLGLGLGLLQLIAGVLVGWTFARRNGRTACTEEANQLYQLAEHVHGLIRDVHGQVDQHQTQIEQFSGQLDESPDDQDDLAATIFRSVSEVTQANGQLQQQLLGAEQKLQKQERQIKGHMAEARTDPLTTLPNRRAFEDAMTQQTALHQRSATPFGLIHLDIDFFKKLNDRWGHPAGDEVLRKVAVSLRQAARQTDLVARVGGEEFAFVLPNTTAQAVSKATERIRAAVEATELYLEGQRVPVTISLGAALIAPGESGRSLIARSDKALYASKENGRNCAHWHDGAACHRITSGQSVSQTVAPTGSEPADAEWQQQASWRTVCDDLRRRLTDLVGGDS